MHHLAIYPERHPMKQAPRCMHLNLAAKKEAEVDMLVKADSIWEVAYPIWLANVVLVKKKNGQIQVCINFRDLKKTCPKNDFPVSHIELLIDATIK